jgi:hypothetical protein
MPLGVAVDEIIVAAGVGVGDSEAMSSVVTDGEAVGAEVTVGDLLCMSVGIIVGTTVGNAVGDSDTTNVAAVVLPDAPSSSLTW